jgi:hypothetical protein
VDGAYVKVIRSCRVYETVRSETSERSMLMWKKEAGVSVSVDHARLGAMKLTLVVHRLT